MKKSLILSLLFSGQLLAQESSYIIQNHTFTNSYDFVVESDNLFSVDYAWDTYLPSISKIPFNGNAGFTKQLSVPGNWTYGYGCNIAKCNLSNDYIITYYTDHNEQCLILKIDENANIIWTKKMYYSDFGSGGEYGSNSTPLTITPEDDIILTFTPYTMMIVTKLNANGQLISSKKIESVNNEDDKNPGFSILCTSDSGYLLTMKNSSNPTVIKLNANFEVVWSKKWSIDSYSHPKNTAELNNGHFCIVGEGDNGTFVAEIDENGNLLNYRSGINMYYPYKLNKLADDTIQIFDSQGRLYTINFTSNLGTMKTPTIDLYGIINFTDDKRNFVNPIDNSFYLNLESEVKDCFDFYSQLIELYAVQFNPNQIQDEDILIENYGTILNFVPTVTTTNGIYFSENCSELALNKQASDIGKLYPNPVKSGQPITIEFSNANVEYLQLFSTTGEALERIKCENALSIEFSLDLPGGLYFIKALDKNLNVLGTQKLIME